MKKNIFLALLCSLCINFSFAQKADPCCEIVGINAAKSIITSRNTTTGKVQQFKTSAAGISSLKIGDKLTLQNGKITAVNQTGVKLVNNMVSGQANDGDPCCTVVSLQVNDGDPCCAIVTAKNLTTGELSSFQTTAGLGRTFNLGQSVNLQNGYAMVQSGAAATAPQKGMYAFKMGVDSAATKIKENAAETSAEKWVISSSGLKGSAGIVSIKLPEGVEWSLDIMTSEDKALGRWDHKWYNNKTINLVPGEYKIFFTYIPLTGVPIQKGMNTRLKAGILDVVTTGQWSIYDENKTKAHVVYYKPTKIGLPIGKYNIQINGQYQLVEIKEGTVTEL